MAGAVSDIPRAHAADCDFLTGTYDYARAARLMASIRTTRGGFAGPGPYLLMIIPGGVGARVFGIDGSGYSDAEMGNFSAGWGRALSESEMRITAHPPRPGLVRSVFDLIVAILGTATGGASGLIEGVFGGF
jgi:hypothetical protein